MTVTKSACNVKENDVGDDDDDDENENEMEFLVASRPDQRHGIHNKMK